MMFASLWFASLAKLAMNSSAVLFWASPGRRFLWSWYMAWIPGDDVRPAIVEAAVPLTGPLFMTETVGARLWMKTGVLLQLRPWWSTWQTRFTGVTTLPSMFQVRSPPSQKRNGPKSRIHALLRSLSEGASSWCTFSLASGFGGVPGGASTSEPPLAMQRKRRWG